MAVHRSVNYRSGLANLVLAFAPLILGGAVSIVTWLEGHWLGSAFAYAASIALFGFVAFASAKISRFSRGDWFCFGSSRMTPDMRALYRCGYAGMGWGLVSLMLASVAHSS